MIEVLNKKEKLEGFIDGKKYMNKKKKMKGFLENNEFKDDSSYTLLVLKDNGAITWSEGQQQGYLKDGKIYSSLHDNPIFEFKKEDGIIIDSEGDTVLYLKGDLESLEDDDFFGITAQFLELFA